MKGTPFSERWFSWLYFEWTISLITYYSYSLLFACLLLIVPFFSLLHYNMTFFYLYSVYLFWYSFVYKIKIEIIDNTWYLSIFELLLDFLILQLPSIFRQNYTPKPYKERVSQKFTNLFETLHKKLSGRSHTATCSIITNLKSLFKKNYLLKY